MPDAQVTLTLPLTQAGAQVLLAALGIALATGLVYLLLDAQGRKPRSDPAMDWLKALGAALVPVWLILLGGTLWHLWLLFDGQASVLADTGFGMGAVIAAFLGGPFVIWGTVIKQETVKYHKEGHITERISKAVEQLGEEKTVKRDGAEVSVPNIEVRIGGLLSLERIAQDSTQNDKGRDHVRVMEILCAYVRENAPAGEARTDNPRNIWETALAEAQEELAPHDFSSKQERAFQESQRAHQKCYTDPDDPPLKDRVKAWVRSLPGPRADIALALQIIGRRSPDQRQVEARWGPTAAPDDAWVFDTPCPELPESEGDAPHGEEKLDAFTAKLDAWKARIDGYTGYRLDLRGTNLQGADLSGLTLSGARLSGARAAGTHCLRAQLKGADLREAQLEGADLFKARMEGANLRKARMEGTNFLSVQMQGANLSGADMARSNLSRAQIQGANLALSQMDGASLFGAWMEGASLARARMEGALLSLAKMEGTNLWSAWLEAAIFSHARMERADLFIARMEGADLWAARMEGANLRRATLSVATSFRDTSLRSATLKDVDLSMLDLTQAQIDAAFGDASVTLPDGLTRPTHWPEWELADLDDPNFHDEYRKWRADPAGYTPPPPPEN